MDRDTSLRTGTAARTGLGAGLGTGQQGDTGQCIQCAVVIPHFNDLDRLARCLRALEVQDRMGVEVVVADNGSDADLSRLRSEMPWVTWVNQPEPGAGMARNAGVMATSAPWLAFLDCDCVPAADWLDQVRRIFSSEVLGSDRHDRATGGRIDVFDETPSPRSGAEAFETVFAFDQQAYILTKGFSVTANLIVPRSVFEQTGPFRSRVSEDMDWCHRARAAGFGLVYDPALRVSHPTRSDWAALRKKWLRLTSESFALCPPGLSGRLKWGARACVMPLSIPVHGVRVLRCSALTGRERGRALATLVRLRLTRMIWMLSQALGGTLDLKR